MKLIATDRGFQLGPVDVNAFDQVRMLAGSAHGVTVRNETWVTIASNIYSLIRLKNFFGDELQFEEGETTDIIQKMKERFVAWREANKLGDAAKAGQDFTPPGYVYKRKLFDHQLKIVNYLHAMRGQCAVFGDPGIGKTAALIVWLDQLKFMGTLQRGDAIVFTKPSIIDSAWLDDIKSFTSLEPFSIRELDLDDAETDLEVIKLRRAAVKGKNWDLLIVGYELAKNAKNARDKDGNVTNKKTKTLPLRNILVNHKPRVVVFDESTEVKSHRSQNFRVARDVSASADLGRVPLTGTPAPNGAEDLWSQMYIVDRGLSLEPSITDFRAQYYKEVKLNFIKTSRGHSPVKYVMRPEALEEVNARITPRIIRVRAEDCLDLPPVMPDVIRNIEMTPTQKRHYRAIKEDLLTDIDDHSVTAFHQVVGDIKLRQIVSGFLIPDKIGGVRQDAVQIPGPNPKLLELDALLEEITPNNKALVFLQFRNEFHVMLERYKKYRPTAIYGETPSNQVGDIVRNFQSSPMSRVLFLHPLAAGYGLTLTAANYCIYYSISYNMGEHEQSRRRIIRPGQEKTMFFYYLLCRHSIERAIYSALRQKKEVQDLLVDGVRKLMESN